MNEAYNGLLIDEEDYQGLKHSIQSYDNFDHLGLAAKLEKHELLEFRRTSALLYKKGLKWRKAVDLAKKDKLFKDAMETAAQSGEPEVAEDLLKYDLGQGKGQGQEWVRAWGSRGRGKGRR